jgi:hypothetical protein
MRCSCLNTVVYLKVKITYVRLSHQQNSRVNHELRSPHECANKRQCLLDMHVIDRAEKNTGHNFYLAIATIYHGFFDILLYALVQQYGCY